MAIVKQVKCPICGQMNDKENTVFVKPRYYCVSCYDIYKNTKQTKENIKKQLKEKTEEQENKGSNSAKDYQDLVDYICALFQISVPTPIMFKQIKTFKNTYNYTYRGMRSTLYYFFEIKDNDVSNSLGVGIIPYAYEDALDFYTKRKNVADSVKKINIEDMRNNKRFINKKIKPDSNIKRTYKENIMLNIEDIH